MKMKIEVGDGVSYMGGTPFIVNEINKDDSFRGWIMNPHTGCWTNPNPMFFKKTHITTSKALQEKREIWDKIDELFKVKNLNNEESIRLKNELKKLCGVGNEK